MKIFFFSSAFRPSVGGIETVVELLCREFVRVGHEVKVATLTPGPADGDLPFDVTRRPTTRRFFALLRWADIHAQAGVSLKYCWPLLIRPRRVVYRHPGVYQRDDGSLSVPDRLKRLIALVTPGIANSRYTASKLRCQYTVFNPYDNAVFRTTMGWDERPGDFVFLGRLVSQKGCDVLVRALALLNGGGGKPRLAIIGDGPDRADLQALAGRLDVREQVRFSGPLRGTQLAEELNRHRFLVVPSRYEEPFGVVALEGLACGCVPIVSQRGGLVDAIGPHGFAVPNGDEVALAAQMRWVLDNPDRAAAVREGAQAHLANFRIEAVAQRYLDVFTAVVNRSSPP